MNRTVLLLLAASTLTLAQQPAGGWRRVGDAPAQQQPPGPVGPVADPEPVDRSDAYGQPAGPQQPPDAPPPQQQRNDRPPSARPPYGLPPEVTLKPGTYLTVSLNQMLSSDRNQPGDTFVGSLAQPIVVDGIVVAHRNQLVYGRVAEAMRARSNQPSRLGLELTGVTLADGSQVPIRSQLSGQQGGTTPTDVQVGTVATTTAVGAVIGGVAGRGTGAAVGAGMGAMAGLAGVLLTRNRPTVLYPESVLTFAVVEPLTISTANAPHAFRFVGPEDYNQPPVRAALQPRPQPVYRYPVYTPYPYPYPYYYGGVSVMIGPRWGGYGYGGYGYGRYGYGRYNYYGRFGRRWW